MYPTEIVTRSRSRMYHKNVSGEHQLFPEAGFVHVIFKTTLSEGLFLSAEMAVREPGAPSRRAQPSSPAAAPGCHHQLCLRRSSHLQTKPGSPARASQLGLPSSSPPKEGFSCRRKASLTGFLLIDPRVRGRVILVSIWPCSLWL